MPPKNNPSENPLRKFRTSLGLSQAKLAEVVGVTAKTIRAWEQGKQKPFDFNRESLAKKLNITEDQLKILLPRSTDDEPFSQEEEQEQELHQQWHMSHPRNEFFTARDELLKQLHTEYSVSENGITRHVLSGLAGVGKTQIAIEYAYRYSKIYQAVLWVNADKLHNIVAGFLRIASLLRLPQRLETNKWSTVDAVKQWLNSHADWLLVFDNVDDPNIIRDFLPQTGHGHLLLTTRDSESFTSIPIEKMEIEDGATLLLARAGLLAAKTVRGDTFENDFEHARKVTEVVDGLPLALDQAGAYITESQCSVAEYLKFYEERRKKLLHERGRNHSGHPLSFATALLLSFDRLKQANPLAADMLRFCAFLYPDNIPEEFFMAGDLNETHHFQPLTSSAFLLAEARRELLRYSFIQYLKDVKTIGIHRLVQAVLQDQMDENTQRRWAEQAVKVLSQLFLPLEEKYSQRYQYYIAHVLKCLDYVDTWALFDEDTFRLLFLAGFYLREQGLYAQAEPICQHTLEVAQRKFPMNFVFEAISLENLAALYTVQGDYEKAEKLNSRAFERSSKASNTSLTVGVLYEEAYRLKMQGKYVKALAFAQQLLSLVGTLSEQESQLRMNVFTFLAELCCLQEDYPQASSLLEQAIAIYTNHREETSLDGTHLLNIIILYFHRQGRDAEAVLLCQPLLGMAEALWGSQHPDMARICTNITEIYIGVNNMVKAEQYSKKAIEIYQAVNQTIQLPRSLCYLAIVCISQGRYFEAEAYFKQAQVIVEEKFESEDKQMIVILTGLINLYQLMRRDEEADLLLKRLQYKEGLQ